MTRYPKIALLLFFTFCVNQLVYSQESDLPLEAEYGDAGTLLWLGSYNTLRLSDKLYWVAQHHFRTSNYDGTPWVGRMAQIYNRHALTYRFSDRFLFTLGPVLRINFTPEPGNEDFQSVTLEPRIWHEYMFPMSGYLGARSFVLQHRIRIEHRWSRSNRIDADWIYRDRWRYRITMKLPISRTTLQPKTFYATPLNVEIIMQSGKSVVNAPMEDLRIYPSVGYIFNTKLSVSVGLMYALGQNLGAGHQYRQRYVARINLWWTPDLRKFENRIPETKFFD